MINTLERLIDNDPRFVEIKYNPSMRKDLIEGLKTIYSSARIKDSCLTFLRDQRDISRYVGIAKKIATLKESGKDYPRSLPDNMLTKDIMIDDLRSFYYQLDIMTDGRHFFTEKLSKLIDRTSFIEGNGRSSVGATYDENGNLKERHINIYVEPLVNSYTVAMHEEWHAMDEKNYNQCRDKEEDQFIGEIGTMFTDKISRDFIISNHGDNLELIDKLNKIQLSNNNEIIDKARESYLDYLLVLSIVGNTQQINMANQEIVNNFGNLWGINTIKAKLEHLYKVAKGDPDLHFDPMFELRYVVGEVVSKALYNSDMSMAEKIDRIATINENILHTDRLNNSTMIPIDRVTNFLGVDNIDVLTDSMHCDLLRQSTSVSSKD